MTPFQKQQQKKLGLKVVSLEAERMPERVYKIDRFKHLIDLVRSKRFPREGK